MAIGVGCSGLLSNLLMWARPPGQSLDSCFAEAASPCRCCCSDSKWVSCITLIARAHRCQGAPNFLHQSLRPSSNWNKKPDTGGLLARYASIAETGHRALFVLPTKTSTPCVKGSVFSLIFNTRGFVWSSTQTSSSVRWLVGSKEFSAGTVISSERKNPKKHTVTAAQSMLWLCEVPRLSRVIVTLR